MTLRSEESWVRDATFLCRLEREDQDRMLAVAQREQVGPRLPLLRGRSGVLLLSGEVEVDNALALGTHRGAPGQLFGASNLAQDREPCVTSATPVELLRWRHEDLDPATVGWAARDLIQDLAELDHQMDVLDDVLRQEPTLRALPPAWREQLLQCCTLRDCAPGEVLVRSGHRSDTLTLLLRGTARLTTAAASPQSGPSSQLIPHGTLLGVQDFDAEQPPVQPYHIDAPSGGRALFIPWRALAHLFKRQRASRPRSVALSRDARRGRAHLIHTVSPNLGASTVAIGTAIALGQQGAKAAVLDLNGGRTAQRLGLDRAQRTIEGLKAWMAPLGPGLPEIWWPARDEDAERLLMELQIRQDHVLIGHVRHGLPSAGVLDRLTTLIHLFAEENDVCEAPLAQHQRMIHALRLPNGGYPGLRTRPRRRPQDDRPAPVRDQIVRIPFDSAVDEVYRRQRAIRQLGMGETPFGRSTHRLARMLLGKATGLALGGGGAWGFAHVGLLRALHEADLPVDYVSGTSFGAVVGAAYVGGGLAALEKLERSTAVMPLIAGGCVLSTAPLGAYMDWLVGPIHQLSTEIPLLAVASDVRTASSYVLPTGTLADAVRSSSGFPGLFASYDFGGRRLVDGGVSANVPAEVAQKAGADFILASNCIPRMMDDRSPVYDAPVLGRAMDLVRSTLAMMHRSSARDAALADHVFNARTGDFAPAEFWAGPRIAELAYEQALGEIPAIRAAYEADLSTHLAEG